MSKAKKTASAKMTREKQIAFRTYPPVFDVFNELADEKKWSVSQWIEQTLLQAAADELKRQGKSIKRIEEFL